jgi:hypothetical protein
MCSPPIYLIRFQSSAVEKKREDIQHTEKIAGIIEKAVTIQYV